MDFSHPRSFLFAVTALACVPVLAFAQDLAPADTPAPSPDDVLSPAIEEAPADAPAPSPDDVLSPAIGEAPANALAPSPDDVLSPAIGEAPADALAPSPDGVLSPAIEEKVVTAALSANPIEDLIRRRAEALDKLEKERNEAFRDRAEIVVTREEALTERERVALAREQQILMREAALNKREAAVVARETIAGARENILGVQEISSAVEKPRANPPSIVGKYACVIDALTGAVLHEKDSGREVAVASTQKLMTALLVIEAGDLDKEVIIEPEDVRVEPTRIGVKPGQTYTRRELVKALLVRSGNDIAQVLARDNAGSISAFADKMNARALSLGMTNTNFINPHGLTEEGQHSTARDMALLGRAAYGQPFVRECVKIKSDTFTFNDGTTRSLINTNKVLSRLDYCTGMKTGYTRASGNCLISSAEKNGRTRIVVVLGSSGSWIWKDSEVLLKWSVGS